MKPLLRKRNGHGLESTCRVLGRAPGLWVWAQVGQQGVLTGCEEAVSLSWRGRPTQGSGLP